MTVMSCRSIFSLKHAANQRCCSQPTTRRIPTVHHVSDRTTPTPPLQLAAWSSSAPSYNKEAAAAVSSAQKVKVAVEAGPRHPKAQDARGCRSNNGVGSHRRNCKLDEERRRCRVPLSRLCTIRALGQCHCGRWPVQTPTTLRPAAASGGQADPPPLPLV